MVAVVVDPFVQQGPDRQVTDGRMLTSPSQVSRAQAGHQVRARRPHPQELPQHARRRTVAITPRPGDRHLVPLAQERVRVLQDHLDAAGKAAPFGFHQVPEHFLDAPFAAARMPGRDCGWKRRHFRAQHDGGRA